jgi:hypothetical protein
MHRPRRSSGNSGDKTHGKGNGTFGKRLDEVMQTRRQDADEFYAGVIPPSLDADAANVMRQALAGMLQRASRPQARLEAANADGEQSRSLRGVAWSDQHSRHMEQYKISKVSPEVKAVEERPYPVE